MIKILIVDDEIIVRVGFQSCIPWEDYGCQVIGTCESGTEAIKQFGIEVPDIVFTDIMMPEMDGIQLLTYIRKHYPKVKVVVLSCINEIEYVKQAIRLGAEDYILKLSFTKDTMVNLIEKLKEEISRERSQGSEADVYTEVKLFDREDGFKTLLSGRLTMPEQEALLDQMGFVYNPFEQYIVGCFLIDHKRHDLDSGEPDVLIMRYGLLNIIREYLEAMPLTDLIFVSNNEIMPVFRIQQGMKMTEGMEGVLELLNGALKTHLNLTLSMGMNLEFCSRLEIPEAYKQAKKLASLRFFDGEASYHQEEQGDKGSFVMRRQVQKSIQEAVFTLDRDQAFFLTNQWFTDMRKFCSYNQIRVIRRFVVETWLYVSGYSVPDHAEVGDHDSLYSAERFWEAETIEELENNFKEAVEILISYLLEHKAMNPEILGLLQYLEEHINENISLEDAARFCGFGKSQFCILFKKTTGETFVNYFNRLKMKQAYGLLRSGNLQVQEVADKLGVQDISYFSRLFKKYYDMNPSDVKKK